MVFAPRALGTHANAIYRKAITPNGEKGRTSFRTSRSRHLRYLATYARIRRAIRKACHGITQLASQLMQQAAAAGPVTLPEEVKWTPDDASRASPVSVTHHFESLTEGQKLALLPLATLSLSFLYQELVNNRLWRADFDRGGCSVAGKARVRSLATRHLRAPATDGWNVVHGATELAHAWAYRASDMPETIDEHFDLPKAMRLRLAVCLCVAWKFERQLASHFPRRFYDEQPNLLSPHTYELAYIGYAFMTDEERAEFGGWREANLENVRQLYWDMVAMEVSLLTSTNTMTLLTRNQQVQAEARIQALFDDAILSANEAMAIRSLVPFFVVASQDGVSERPRAGELVCAAMLCVRMVEVQRKGRAEECEIVMRSVFTPREREAARVLLHRGRFPPPLATSTLLLGCYNDHEWVNYPYVYNPTIEQAYAMAEGLVP